MTIIEELAWRGLVADCTDSDALAKRLAGGPATLYCGFDPTGTPSTSAASSAS
jgi:tyrosyl-tRNA synthetase